MDCGKGGRKQKFFLEGLFIKKNNINNIVKETKQKTN